MIKGYNTAMDNIALTDEQKERIIKAAIGYKKKTDKRRTYFKYASGVAACLAVCVMSVPAVKRLSDYNSQPVAVNEMTDKNGEPTEKPGDSDFRKADAEETIDKSAASDNTKADSEADARSSSVASEEYKISSASGFKAEKKSEIQIKSTESGILPEADVEQNTAEHDEADDMGQESRADYNFRGFMAAVAGGTANDESSDNVTTDMAMPEAVGIPVDTAGDSGEPRSTKKEIVTSDADDKAVMASGGGAVYSSSAPQTENVYANGVIYRNTATNSIEYASERNIYVDDTEVTLRFDEVNGFFAVWYEDGMANSIESAVLMPDDEIADIIRGLKK